MIDNKTRDAIGTVWHTTENGKDIVSMHDAQYRAHIARIAELIVCVAELEEAVRLLAEAWYAAERWEAWQGAEEFLPRKLDTARAIHENPIAREALEKAMATQ